MSDQVKHLALDGSVVTIDTSDGLDLQRPASSIGVYSVDGIEREFTGSHRDFGRDVAADVGLVLDEEYALQGGTFLAGSVTQVWPEIGDAGDPITSLLRLGVWEGDQYSLHAHIYGGDGLDLIDLFNRFTIIETDLGIQLLPGSPGAGTSAREPSLLKDVPGVGLLDIIALTTREVRALPRWQGTRVRGGELFLSEVDGRGRYYVLVGGSARTAVLPASDCSHSTLAPALETLQVSWTRAGR
jgi:hypothetical protein